MKYPTVYKAGQMGLYFSYGKFWKWIFQAVYHGALTYYMIMQSSFSNPENSSGLTKNHWVSSTIIFTLIIHLVCLKLFVETNYWNTVSILAAVFSLLIYYIVLVLGSTSAISSVFQNELNGMI